MAKSFADIESDLRFQLDLVRLASCLNSPSESPDETVDRHAGMVEELVRVQRRNRQDGRLSA